MDIELDKKLCEKYPKIMASRNRPMTETCMCWGFSHGDGWYSILDNLCGVIQNRIDNTIPKPPQVVFAQVKEKFGTLRVYTEGSDDTVDGVIMFAEYLSARTCEVCGETDPKLVGRTRKGWLSTVCAGCRPQPADQAGWISVEDAEKEVAETEEPGSV